MSWCALNLILYQCNFIYLGSLWYWCVFSHRGLIFDPNSFTDQQIGGCVVFLFAFSSQGCRWRRSLQVEHSLDDTCLRGCLPCLYVHYSVSPPWVNFGFSYTPDIMKKKGKCVFICRPTWIRAQTWEMFAVGITCTYFKVISKVSVTK